MNLSFIESLLDKVVKPDRVEIKLLDRKFLLIQSAENTNDTIGPSHPLRHSPMGIHRPAIPVQFGLIRWISIYNRELNVI